MNRSAKTAAPQLYEVRQSPVHGKGVFALDDIPAGERIIEYRGERISWDDATRRAAERGGPVNHTFYFTLADGRVTRDERVVLFNCASGLKYPLPRVDAAIDRTKPINFRGL